MKKSHIHFTDEGVGSTSLCRQAVRATEEPAPLERPVCLNCQRIVIARGYEHLLTRPEKLTIRQTVEQGDSHA